MLNDSDSDFADAPLDKEEFFTEEEEQSPAALAKLREKLKKAVEEKQEYLDGWQRSRADFANYKREEASMAASREERTKSDLIESLLPALDSFEMALKHSESKEYALVYKQLIDSLKSLGVEKFGAQGDSFDPRIHEALMQKGDGETIQSVERSGYKTGNTVIRAAQVVI
ncbi:MAG TPA: nucleotide exchange factor GrpE [Candidatus Paceibacterota bacterium]|nr:nucleotide exchange factor GrpE [Candidatus Paceibacterota bacterium]